MNLSAGEPNTCPPASEFKESTMKRIACYVLATSCLASIIMFGAASLSSSWVSVQTAPSLAELTNLPPVPLPRLHLYPGDIDPATKQPTPPLDRGVEIPQATGFDAESAYLAGQDLSTDDVHYAPDGKHKAWSQSYYSQAGELFRRPHVKTTYDGVSDAVVEEDARHRSGTREKWTRVEASGAKRITEYADNGLTVLLDQEFSPKEGYQLPQLKFERHWRDDPAHSLAYSDILNGDGTRDIVWLDSKENQLRIEHWAKYHLPDGTTITEYDPVTFKKRFVSKTENQLDTTDFYGPDGIRSYTLKLKTGTTDITYYDSTGTKALLEQEFMHIITYKDGVTNSSDVISDLTEFDANGVKIRTLDYTADSTVLYEDRFNLTVNGVTYKHAMFVFDADGFLHHVSYYLKEGLAAIILGPNLEQDYTPKANIRLVLPPADELVLKVKLDIKGLPMPTSDDWGP
jgi:hypothetical protein